MERMSEEGEASHNTVIYDELAKNIYNTEREDEILTGEQTEQHVHKDLLSSVILLFYEY